MIILRPDSGLCNRLRAIGSAIRLARECGSSLTVEWYRCPLRRWAGLCGMRVGFCDLFEPLGSVPVREKIKVRNDFPWNAKWWNAKNPQFYGEERRAQFVEDVKSEPSVMRRLRTCHDFYHNEDWSWMRPRAEILNSVDAVSESFGRNCIGIHIRRTDNRAAIAASPLTLFIDKMDAEERRDATVRFFLSTDDADTRMELKQRYGDRLVFCANVAPRYTIKGERDALVDLLLLSRTKKIYGSYWSSFSQVAAQIGHLPLEVLVAKGVELPPWAVN